SFVSCSPGCNSPGVSDGGKAEVNFDTLGQNIPITFSVTAKVNAAAGTTLNATANVSSANPDPNLANNGRAASVRVAELFAFTDAQKISMSPEGHYVLALRRGTVWAWGHNFYGQIGNGTNSNQPTPAQVEDLMSVIDISAGHDFAVALKSDGTVWTWGSNEFGRLGIGTSTPSTANRPLKVVGLSSITAIAAGNSHTLALRADGTVWAWGANASGELGLGTSDFGVHATPVQVQGLSGIVAIYNRGRVCYAVKADGTVFGWGTTFSGTLGDGTSGTPGVMSPIELPALKGMKAASTGLISTVVIKADNTVLSFGNNFRGQLGRGLPDNGPYPTPAQISSLVAKHISNGSSVVLVTDQSGALKVFGRNDDGQLGLGSKDLSAHPMPISVPGLTNVVATVAGSHAALALIDDPSAGRTIRSWGVNADGELGLGSVGGQNLIPTVVPESPAVAQPIFSIAAGTIPATQVQIACGTPGSVIHYTTNGSDPTESDPIVAHGGTVLVNSSMTLKARAFRAGLAASSVRSATYTVVAAVPLQLMIDQTGPALDQVAAFDLLTLLRDPFPVVSINDLLYLGTDKNTRLVVFVSNLQQAPNEPASAVVVNLVGSNSQIYDVPAEDVRPIANSDFIQVSFRLPDTLVPGTCTIRIKSHAQVSNAGTIRIKP
ncbi:MAG TPA: chitobiase/beta-hexosaminidase C-terminal domain-containing protein, partial [Pyrinomonadaceae bacterium]|nr:chitobiase/beta-hexosaminidase C-terminal domain-containing protein [Pyrinomonadaceae bacterium]